VGVKIATLTASGLSQPDAARFSADAIEATDIEIGGAVATQPALSLSYKVPRIIVKGYSGPAALQPPPASSSFVDLYRFALKQFTGITAASIMAPSLAGTINSGSATPGGGEVAYSSLAMQGIKDGKVTSLKIDGFVFTLMQATGKPDKLTGNLANLASYDIDINAMASIFDPLKVNDDQYYRAYRQISAGPYVVTSGQGMNMRIEGMTIDDVRLRPSRLQLPALLAVIPPPGTTPTPAQAREMLERVAGIYEGVGIGNAEMHGLSRDTPQGPIKLSTMRFNLEDGKVGEFAMKASTSVRRKGPPWSSALRSNPSTSPTSCECRRCTQIPHKSLRLIRLSGCFCCSKALK